MPRSGMPSLSAPSFPSPICPHISFERFDDVAKFPTPQHSRLRRGHILVAWTEPRREAGYAADGERVQGQGHFRRYDTRQCLLSSYREHGRGITGWQKQVNYGAQPFLQALSARHITAP